MWKNTLWYKGQLAPWNPGIQIYNVRYLFSSDKASSCFWTLFDTCPCYRHISFYVSSFISLIFWKNDIVIRPTFWKINIIFTYDFLEKYGKWRLGLHTNPVQHFLWKLDVGIKKLLSKWIGKIHQENARINGTVLGSCFHPS